MIQIKRIYEDATDSDGYRILIDKLWPRGVSKIRAHLDEWDKTISPSTELRKWFGHKAERMNEFTELYKAELNQKTEDLERIKAISKTKTVTLLYAARDPKINHAVVLQSVLNNLK